MNFITGADRDQSLLLPETLDDYIGSEAPVRFIDAFVDGLDLDQCGFARSKPASTGRPPYSPTDLLKLYVWGYLNQICSSRKLERECGRNLELIWLLRKLRPDFKTIADFRKDNRKAFKGVFRAFNLLCREMKLFGAELVAIDGTKLKAVNSTKRSHSRKELIERLERIDKHIEEYLEKTEDTDNLEQSGSQDSGDGKSLKEKLQELRGRKAQCEEQLEALEESKQSELSETDPDSRRMLKVGVGYNGQIAVDSKNHLVVAQEVVQDANDLAQLAPMAQSARQELGVEQLGAVVDMGYYDHQQIAQCEQMGVVTYAPRPQKGTAEANGRFGKKDFQYDGEANCYRCPNTEVLMATTEFKKRGELHVRYENPPACKRCPLKGQCTSGPHRTVTRWKMEAIIDQMHKRVEANPQIIALRKTLVEHVFGTSMFWMNQRTFLTRGLESVRGEFTLTVLAYNIKRVLNLMSVKELLEKLKKPAGIKDRIGLSGLFLVLIALLRTLRTPNLDPMLERRRFHAPMA